MRVASTSSFRKYAASTASPETPRDHAMFASASMQSVLPEKPPKDDSMPQMATMISPGTPYSRSTSPSTPACCRSSAAPRSTRSRETILVTYLRTLFSETFRAAASDRSRAARARAASSGVAGAGAGAGAGSGSDPSGAQARLAADLHKYANGSLWLEFFYEEQLQRMECLSQEPVLFEDILCQMSDMLHPGGGGRSRPTPQKSIA